MHYNIEAAGGYSHTCHYPESNPCEEKILDKAIKEKTLTVWIGGSCGILEDWGTPVEKTVKRITKHNDDGTSEIIYEKPSRKK